MTKEELKQYIDQNIYENVDGDISGDSLNEILKAIVDDGGTEVEANPTGEVTDTLGKLKIGETIYTAPQGPQGEPGEDGQDGQPGAPGPANTLTIGTVQSGEQAAANITGTAPNQQLNLVLPKGEQGDPGQNAVNPFKGWYNAVVTGEAGSRVITSETQNLPANPVVGDYAYVKTWDIDTTQSPQVETPIVKIYECATAGTWTDSGRTADTSNVQTFASSEEVYEVHIVDDLITGGEHDVLSAEQGKQLNEKLYNHYDDSIVSETDYYDPYMSSETLGTYFMGGAFEKDENNKYYWFGRNVGNARINYIPQSVLGTIKGTYRKLRVIGGPSSTNYSALVMFAKKALPTSTNLTFQQMVEGGYICDGFTEDNYIISISTSGSLPNGKELVIPSDANYFYAVRKSANGNKRGPSSVVPFSAVVEGDVDRMQQEISELQQQGIPDGAVTTAKIADGAVTKEKIAAGAVDDSLVGEVEEYMSFNLLDYSSLVTGTYLDNGVVKTGAGSSYAATNRISLQGKKVWWGGVSTFGNYGGTNGAAVFDAQGNVIRSFKPTNEAVGSYDPLTSGDDGAAYIQLTIISLSSSVSYVVYAKEDGTNPMADWASATTGNINKLYRKQIVKHSNQSAVFAKEKLPELIPAYSMCGQDAKRRTIETIASYATIGTDYPAYIKCCHTISCKVNLPSEFSGNQYLRIGINHNDTTGKALKITPTQAIIERYDSSYGYVTNVAYNHGLTISDFVMCEITFNWHGGKMRIVTNGGSYVKEWSNSEYSYTLNAQVNYGRAFVENGIGVEITNTKLTQTSEKFKCPVWVFGDSFVSMSEARWTYQMVNTFGIDGFLLDGFAGAKSGDIYPDLVKALNYGTPKYLLWCLGSNDNPVLWKYYETAIEQICRDRGITLILMTVPRRDNDNVAAPPIYQEKITQYVIDSDYRYFDERAAVSADENGNWYSGMRSSDNCHPTVLGAKVIAAQLLVDFPEIANYK